MAPIYRGPFLWYNVTEEVWTMEYVRHKYSKRVYKIMTDHGLEHPYLLCFPHVRYCSRDTIRSFFSPCDGPTDEPPVVSVGKEIWWERSQAMKKRPIEVKPPEPTVKKAKKRTPQSSYTKEGYTLRELCGEIGMDPATARKLLRSKGKTPPPGGWKWGSKEEAKPIRRFLRKF